MVVELLGGMRTLRFHHTISSHPYGSGYLALRFGLLLPILVVLVGAAGPAMAQGSPSEKGAQVFVASKCAACHSIAGKGNAKGELDAVGSRLTAGDIREWIVNAPAMAAKTKAQRKPLMKAFSQLAPEEVEALVAYLQTLKK